MRIKITLVLFFVSAVKLFAQPGDPSADPDVPITGIEILLAVGGALGAKKLFNTKNRKNESD